MTETVTQSHNGRVRGRIWREQNFGRWGWEFTVDWVAADGQPDLTIGSYEYGTVYDDEHDDDAGHAAVVEVVDGLIREFNEKWPDLPYGSPRPS